MRKYMLYTVAVAVTVLGVTTAHGFGLGNIDYGAAAQRHLDQYGLSAGYLAGVNSALDSARSFLRQDISNQSRAYSSYSPYSYSPYSYQAASYSPYSYVIPYYYYSW